MGRKIEMKKIEDVTKCQVTFSKRRSSMMKKANEIAVCCDVDVAFVAFSPSGRVSKFCNQKRIEEVLNRYVNLPPDKRFIHLTNVQGKMEKLRQLRHINGDHSKLHYLEKQIENLELQIKKSGLELQILETDLRDFEIVPGQEPSLHQLSWCEKNLIQSLEVVVARKDALVELEIQSKSQPQSQSQSHVAFQAPLVQNLPIINPNPISNQMIMQLDPWISPYSARVRENIFQNMVGQANPPTNQLPNPIVMPNVPIQEPKPFYISQQQPPMMDQPLHILNDPNIVNTLKQSVIMDEALFNFNDQNNVVNASSHAVFSDAIQVSTHTPMLTINDTTPSSNKSNTAAPNPNKGAVYEVGSGSQSKNSNAIPSQVSQEVEQVNNTPIFNGNNNTSENNNVVVNGEVYTINVDEVEANTPHVTAAGNQVFENEWAANLSKSAWEWEAMFLDEHFNFQHMP